MLGLAPVLGVAFFLAILPLSRFDVHLRVRNNTVISGLHGCLRFYTWDAERWAIKFPPGLSVEDPESWRNPNWWPKVHLGVPSLNRGIGQGQYSVAIPLWMLGALSTAAWWGMRRAAWHRETWECRRCGYDLSGLDAKLCPECGAAAGPAPYARSGRQGRGVNGPSGRARERV